MPWNDKRDVLMTKDLIDGVMAKSQLRRPDLRPIAPKINQWANRDDSWRISPFARQKTADVPKTGTTNPHNNYGDKEMDQLQLHGSNRRCPMTNALDGSRQLLQTVF
jgi:hypothetical protein